MLYTHSYPDYEVLENSKFGVWRYGIAIETQNSPIGLYSRFIEDSILKQGD